MRVRATSDFTRRESTSWGHIIFEWFIAIQIIIYSMASKRTNKFPSSLLINNLKTDHDMYEGKDVLELKHDSFHRNPNSLTMNDPCHYGNEDLFYRKS